MTKECASPSCDVQFEPNVHNQKFHSPECKRDFENASRRRQYVEDIAAAVAPAYMESDEHIEYLRSENQRLGRAVDRYKKAHIEWAEIMYRAVAENIRDIQLAPSQPSKTRQGQGSAEVACIGVADLQLGKVTPSYNTQVCEERMELYAEKVIEITNIQRSDHPVNEAHLWVVGDIVEGEEIFAAQSHLIDRSLYAQVAKDGPRIMGNFVRRMTENFERVKFIGVIGNHGRLTRTINPETNMDRMLYTILGHIFANEPRVEFDIPDGPGERSFFAVDRIGDHATLLVHGDQFPSPTSSHAYLKKVLGWKTSGIKGGFDSVFMGHYHHPIKMSFGHTTLRISGSPESDNTFAQEFIGHISRPSQHLEFIHPTHGTTAEYDVWLGE